MREDGADERRPRLRASAAACAAVEHRDARELADPPGQHGVREQADARTPRTPAGNAAAAAASPGRSPSARRSARATTESRFSTIAATTHCQLTALNASATSPQSGPRHHEQRDRADQAGQRGQERPQLERGSRRPHAATFDTSGGQSLVDLRRAAGRCRPRSSARLASSRAARPSAARRGSSASSSRPRRRARAGRRAGRARRRLGVMTSR